MAKLKCGEGNVQCGGKCQPKHYKCPSEKGLEVSAASNKFTSLITQAPPSQPKDLEAMFGDYEKLISTEGKKASRAKIKGFSKERELKKELLRAEEKAWVFVRLMREKKRLSKKGGDTSDLEALLQKIADGDKDSINKALADLDLKIAEKRKAKVETTVSKPIAEAVDAMVRATGADLVPSREEILKKAESLYEKSHLARSIKQSIDQDALRTIPHDYAKLGEILDQIADIDVNPYERSNKLSLKPSYVYKVLEGDRAEDMPIVGDESLRDAAESPPLPSFIMGNSEAYPPADISIKKFFEEAEVMVQVSPNALIAIVKDGKMKNMFESVEADALSIGGQSEYYRGSRLRTENELLGVEYDAVGKERPIYGYIESPHYANSAPARLNVDHYGDIQIVLKKEVKKRASMTAGDSLDSFDVMAVPMLKPTNNFFSENAHIEGGDITNVREKGYDHDVVGGNSGIDYIEAQIFGGVSIEDIARVTIPTYIIQKFPELISILVSKQINYIII